MLYCPSCDEECDATSHSMCLTCGDELVSIAPTSAASNGSDGRSQHDNETARGLAQLLLANTINNANHDHNGVVAALIPLVARLDNRGTAGQNGGISDVQDLLPPEALNPQSGTSMHRPVSEKILNGLKRTVLTQHSAELFEAHVCLYPSRRFSDLSPSMEGESISFNAVPGEFEIQTNDDQTRRIHPKMAAALVICSPRTIKGGLSSETLAKIAKIAKHRIPYIAYVERGDGITFVQKALACQRAGQVDDTGKSLCIGVIVGNTTLGGNEVWPYTMQDHRNESHQFGLNVPVVMIRRADGATLVKFAAQATESGASEQQYTPCEIKVDTKEAHSCPVCTDSYEPGATIIRLPFCGHVFHDYCATAWLTKHNTCPYCRKEFSTDDEEYERERRRREASAANLGDVGSSGADNFYG